MKKKYAAVAAADDGLATTRATTTKNGKTPTNSNNWRPLFFLGVFPVFMSIVVVLNRDDLREEVNARGIGRFLEDYKQWRRKPRAATSTEQQQQQGEQQQQGQHEHEHEHEYERILNNLQQQKDVIATNSGNATTASRNNSSNS